MRKEGGAVTKEQKKATRQALRRYGEGSVCAAWAQEKVSARLYVGRTTYYTKELEALSTVAVCAADAGLLPGGQMSGVF